MTHASDTLIKAEHTAGVLFLRYGLPLVLLLLILVFGIANPVFVSGDNISSMIRSASIAGLMFLGLTWVFAVGEIDISFVGVAALTNMIIAGMILAGYNWYLCFFAGFLAGTAVGLINGFLVSYLKLPSLVTTIATSGIASALAASIGLGSSIALPSMSSLSFLTETTFGPIPLIAPFCAVFFLVAWHVQEKLALGHYIYAIADNRNAVLEAGIPVKRIILMLFVFSAICSSIAGMLLTLELSSGQPSIASSYFLDGLTAVLLGSTMLKLGKPNVIGTLFSVLILAALVRGGALLGWPESNLQIIKGLLLLAGVAVIIWSNEQ